MFDLTTVGHFAIDTILAPTIKQPKPTLGGPPTYASVAAAKLSAKVSVVSKVGGDFPAKYSTWLRNNGVNLSGLRRSSRASTTRYLIEYRDSDRTLRLQSRAPPILPIDFPRDLRSAAVHVAPIVNELSPRLVAKARRSTEILSLDPQGFLRSFDLEGKVRLKRWLDPETLGQLDVLKSTSIEVQAMVRTRTLESAMKQISDHGIKTVIVTVGTEGSKLLSEGQIYDIPAVKPKRVIDPTGAGDAYIGAFLAEHARGKDAVWCASVGAAAASFVVEGIGPARFGEREEVYQRAQTIYQKVTGKQK